MQNNTASAILCFIWSNVINFVITHVGIAAGVGRAYSRVCLCVCLSVCPRSNRKRAWTINTKLGTRILCSSRSVCIEPEVKGQGHTVMKTITFARLLVTMASIPWTCAGCVNCSCCRRGSACRYDCLRFLV